MVNIFTGIEQAKRKCKLSNCQYSYICEEGTLQTKNSIYYASANKCWHDLNNKWYTKTLYLPKQCVGVSSYGGQLQIAPQQEKERQNVFLCNMSTFLLLIISWYSLLLIRVLVYNFPTPHLIPHYTKADMEIHMHVIECRITSRVCNF